MLEDSFNCNNNKRLLELPRLTVTIKKDGWIQPAVRNWWNFR